jgi:serine/threonine-protein kinase
MVSGTSPITPRFSPDGKRLAFSATTEGILVYDLARSATTRLTPGSSAGGLLGTNPVWTPDGRHLVYQTRDNGIVWIRSDGSIQPQPIYKPPSPSAIPESFTPDGHYLAFHQSGAGPTGREVWIVAIDATDPDHPKPGTPEVLLAAGKANIVEPRFSPDGRWLAYASNESGMYQIFVRPFSPGAKAAGQAQISVEPARGPQWSRTAKEIFYLGTDGRIMVVPYTVNGQTFEPGKPRVWAATRIQTPTTNHTYDLAPDGTHFAVIRSLEGADTGEKANLHLVFLLNFFDFMKRR